MEKTQDVENPLGHILGEEPTEGVRAFFYLIDPFEKEQYVRAPNKFYDGNALWALAYFGAILAYATWSIITLTNLPPIEENSMILSSEAPSINVHFDATCSISWTCGNHTEVDGEWITYEEVSLREVWIDVPPDSPCIHRNGLVTPLEEWPLAGDLSLCVSDSSLDGIFIDVPFSAGSYGSRDAPYLLVTLTGAGGMKNQQRIEIGQMKSVSFSQTVIRDEILGTEVADVFAADMFYEGHTSEQFGQLGLKVQQYSHLTVRSSAGSWVDALAGLGGFATFSLTAMLMLRAVVFSILAKRAAGGSADHTGGLADHPADEEDQ